ncbi:MAG: hypothetical protein ABIC82_01395 [bacterium]
MRQKDKTINKDKKTNYRVWEDLKNDKAQQQIYRENSQFAAEAYFKYGQDK